MPVDARFIRVLALPTFGLALAISVVTTYVPVLLRDVTTSGAAIGLAVGGEGLFALFLPLLVGALSDRTPPTRLGRRLPYLIAVAPVLAVSLVLIPFAGSYWPTVGLIALFFVAYFVYYPPYGALFGDLLPRSAHTRAQGAQALMRGLGLGAALVGGGLLLAVWAPLPFVFAALAVLGATVLLARSVGKPATARSAPVERPKALRAVLREHPELRRFVVANSLWELSFAGLKTFIVLFIVEGLGHSVGTASALIGVVAGAYVLAAIGTGPVAERFGLGRVMRAAACLYGLGLLFGALPTSLGPFLVGLPLVALSGAMLLTLPYGLLLKLMPPGSEGVASGLYGFSRGVGGILGPILVGVSIDLFRPLFTGTHGYGAMWIAIGVPILLSLRFLPAVEEPDPAREQPVLVASTP